MELDEMDLRILEVIEEEGQDLSKVIARIEEEFDLDTDIVIELVHFIARKHLGIQVYY